MDMLLNIIEISIVKLGLIFKFVQYKLYFSQQTQTPDEASLNICFSKRLVYLNQLPLCITLNIKWAQNAAKLYQFWGSMDLEY